MPSAIVPVILACLALNAVGSAAAADPTPSVLPILPPESLYAAGGPVPAGPAGEILAQVELRAPEGARKWAVIYRSTSFDGSPIGVSGLIVAPSTPRAPGEPPRTVLSIAHATTGLADACAPSGTPSDGLVTTALPLLEQGFVLAVTDYEGLGTPGPHPYIVGRSEGQAVLDAVLAAAAMRDAGEGLDTGAGTQTVLVGGSQGGHAVLWAADMAATTTPDLDVLGAVAFAPAGDLEAIARLDHSESAGPEAWSSIVTLVSAWHQVYDLPLDVLTPEAQVLASRLDTACDVRVDTEPTVVDIASRPEWQARLRENTPAATRTDVPVLIFQGDADQVVPIESTRSLVDRMCAVGDTVDLRILPGADHSGSLSASSLLETLGWVSDRLTGAPAASTCPTT
jgi:alpha-beta hydrolase superfamily lysophospholipase